ncbi:MULTISPECIES: hypothetical protein [unclassified Helicobacter]|uniref:hypothetical protein n=1 Tax=unclassified Helicobacter TaxID=2593540 RepID=UPI0012E87A0F|nr:MULTISPECIES: hypothetical protein [unclassified Helicobacter]
MAGVCRWILGFCAVLAAGAQLVASKKRFETRENLNKIKEQKWIPKKQARI